MTSIVEGFMLEALHVFQVRTLQSLGYSTRVTLSNKSHNKGSLATDYRVDVTIYSPDGASSKHVESIAYLPKDEAVSIDCTQWQNLSGEDQIMIFHLMPMRLLPHADSAGQVNIDRSEIWSLFTAQDHYVEYFRLDGFSSGVLYQSGAFNYSKFSREETTVIQAPKVFLTSTLDTVLSILHTSFERDYQRDAVLRCCLLSASGKPVAQWVEHIKPFTAQSISIKQVLRDSGQALPNDAEIQTYTLLCLCDNAALLPLVLNVDTTHETLAVEHSLPPMYYGNTVTGLVRAQMITELRNSGMFPQ